MIAGSLVSHYSNAFISQKNKEYKQSLLSTQVFVTAPDILGC